MRSVINRFKSAVREFNRNPTPYVEPSDQFIEFGSKDLYERMAREGYVHAMFGTGPWMGSRHQDDGNPAGVRIARILAFVHPNGRVRTLEYRKQMHGAMTFGSGDIKSEYSPEEFLAMIVEYRINIIRHQPLDAIIRKFIPAIAA